MNLREHSDVLRFVQAARAYCDLIESPVKDVEQWLECVLRSLSDVYASVLRLPEIDDDEFPDLPKELELDYHHWQQLWNRLGNTLGEARWYWAHFDPTEPPASATKQICGCLADDLADIYCDIKPRLSAWDRGDDTLLPTVVWDWSGVLFRSHWGLHAVDALRALHRLVYLRGLPNA